MGKLLATRRRVVQSQCSNPRSSSRLLCCAGQSTAELALRTIIEEPVKALVCRSAFVEVALHGSPSG